jgi:hypothetical protein
MKQDNPQRTVGCRGAAERAGDGATCEDGLTERSLSHDGLGFSKSHDYMPALRCCRFVSLLRPSSNPLLSLTLYFSRGIHWTKTEGEKGCVSFIVPLRGGRSVLSGNERTRVSDPRPLSDRENTIRESSFTSRLRNAGGRYEDVCYGPNYCVLPVEHHLRRHRRNHRRPRAACPS